MCVEEGGVTDDQDIAQHMKKLSALQRETLRYVLAQAEAAERAGGLEAGIARNFGATWHPSRGLDDWSATDRAVFSRTLRRLEHRGLVVRHNHVGGPDSRRTTNVLLTPIGRLVAKRLTSDEHV